MAKKFKIRKGDTVMAVTGRDKGKVGEVLRVYRDDDRVLVQGVNIVKRHTKQSQTEQGGIIDKEAPIHISNVAMRDPKELKTDMPTKIGFKFLDDGRKVRVARRSGEVIDR